MMKHSSLFLFAFGAMVFACTAAPAGGIPAGDDDKQESNATSVPPKGSNPSTPSTGSTPSNPAPSSDPGDAAIPPGTDAGTPPPPTPTDPGLCLATPDFNTCVDCCDQANPNAFDAADQAWGDCVCQTPGVCAQACGNNFCAGGQPSFACEQCLDNNAAQCDQIADAACQANAACSAAANCFDASKCDEKP